MSAALDLLAPVLGGGPGALGAARADTPLAALGADAFALVLWADAVEAAHPGARVAPGPLATARVVGDLDALLSATIGAGQVPPGTSGDEGGSA